MGKEEEGEEEEGENNLRERHMCVGGCWANDIVDMDDAMIKFVIKCFFYCCHFLCVCCRRSSEPRSCG